MKTWYLDRIKDLIHSEVEQQDESAGVDTSFINNLFPVVEEKIRLMEPIFGKQNLDEKTVVIKSLSDQRRGAPEAQALYEETVDSIKARMDASELRRIMRQNSAPPDHRPNKKQRRQIHQFKHQSEIE